MYKATHSFAGTQDHILSFSAGNIHYILEKNNASWWLASNSSGKVGYVPKDYFQPYQDDSQVILNSIDTAITDVYASAVNGVLNEKQKVLLKKLIDHKNDITGRQGNSSRSKTSTRRRAPSPPRDADLKNLPEKDASSTSSSLPRAHSQKTTRAPPPPQRVGSIGVKPQIESIEIHENTKQTVSEQQQQQSQIHKENVSDRNLSQIEIPCDLGSELLQVLHITLGTKEAKNRDALKVLLEMIKNRVPPLETVVRNIQDTIPKSTDEKENDKLGLALANIKEIKDDAQQRNWAIEDDEEKIAKILNEILTELTSLEKEHSIDALSHDVHAPLLALVEYHQMEMRIPLRLLILQILGAVCSLSASLISVLLASVLPLELVMDIINHTEEEQKTCYSALVLSMLFSTGEPVPVGHYGRLDKHFVQFLTDFVEDNQSEQVAEMFIHVILSFNLHFVVPSENIVMGVIKERQTCTQLSEKIMMLVNRGDDPVVMEEHWVDAHSGQPPQSVLKFLQDLFSQPETSKFFYTNDMNVLLDIITRNLTDLSGGDKLRTEYLDLLLHILTNTDYGESRHRADDLASSLHRILEEEEPEDDVRKQVVDFDKRIVGELTERFGHFFV